MKNNNLFCECNKKQEDLVYRSYYKDFFKEVIIKKTFIIPLSIILILFIIGFIFCHFYNID